MSPSPVPLKTSYEVNPPTQPEVISSEIRLTNLLNDPCLSGCYLTPIPKIQKVQSYLRERTEFAKYYSPKLLSIGPIHHGHENLMLGEHYKQKWTRAYLEGAKRDDTKTIAQELRRNLASNIQDLKKLYVEDAVKNHDDEFLIWVLFVDGCSVLHIINNAEDWGFKAADKLKIKIDQLAILLQDMLLLENQLPYKVLKLLITDDRYNLEESMLKLLQNHNMLEKPGKHSPRHHNVREKPNPSPPSNATNPPDSSIPIESPAHLLDLLHKILVKSTTRSPSPKHQSSCHYSPPPSPKHQSGCHQSPPLSPKHQSGCHQSPAPSPKHQSGCHQSPLPSPKHQSGSHHSYKIRNIQELKAAGIKVKRSQKASIEDVDFVSRGLWGHLKLPEIIVDDFTAPTLMNLIAYEMCPGFLNNFEISSYVAFLDLLIDHPDDVKELRSAGVLQNHLGNDEEVAKLFNTISTDLIADISKYASVRDKIEKHCNAQWKTWMAQVYHDHFSSPWTLIAFFTVVLVTVLTIVQTWYTVWPASS